jgi:antitoxin (DNA-binding transcriptional repressor) of toxin-antitoxin stability system
MKTISLSELLNGFSSVLLEVESGQSMRITLEDVPIADLVPISKLRRTFIERADMERFLARSALDRNFAQDVDATLSGTINEF